MEQGRPAIGRGRIASVRSYRCYAAVLVLLVAVSIGIALSLSGCGATFLFTPSPPVPHSTVSPIPGSPIQHIVVIMQENRSFDNLFNGFAGADTVQSGMN